MAKYTFFNITKANAEIAAGHEAIDAALVAANIATVKVDGKEVPATDAKLSDKIAALNALVKVGDASQDVAELTASNGLIAGKVEGLETELATANAKNETLSRENVTLNDKVTQLQGSVTTLTTQLTEKTALLEASNKEALRVTKEKAAQETEIAKLCVATGCVELKDDNGAALDAKATEEQKLAAAIRHGFDNNVKAYRGAVNAAIAKTGSTPLEIPSAPPAAGATKKPELTGSARMAAATKIAGQ